MEIAFFLVLLVVAVLVLSAAARRIDVPAPFVLIAAGVGASYLPFIPEVHLHHDVVLFGLLPPLLYSAALQTSLVEFYASRRSIVLLSVGLVLFTTAGVAAVVHTLLPGLSWPLAFAIGAVVAPPDAVSATAIGRRIGLPRRVVTVLEGESLLNDATALVSLRTAIAATAGTVELARVGLEFLLAAGGGVGCGLVAYWLVARVRRQVSDPVLDTGISLVTPFAAYLAAERVEASGVLAVVVAGLLLGHRAPILQSASSRIAESTNWRTVAFLLENTVFLLIGLQAHWIVAGVAGSDVGIPRIVAICGGTLAAVVLLRMLWVLPARLALGLRGAAGPSTSTWAETVLVGWAGMRGVVTLAAAFVIPSDTPHREILLLVAFTVVAGTIFLQGTTLPWLARRLRVPAPDPGEHARDRLDLLRQASAAGLRRLDELRLDDRHGIDQVLRDRADWRDLVARDQLAEPDEVPPSEIYNRARREMIAAERACVLRVRSTGELPSAVVSEVLATLDVEESMLDRTRRG